MSRIREIGPARRGRHAHHCSVCLVSWTHRHGERCTRSGEQRSLRGQLAENAGAARTHRTAKQELTFTREPAHEEQIHNVHTGHEKHDEHGEPEHELHRNTLFH